jgi:hypothetical protein
LRFNKGSLLKSRPQEALNNSQNEGIRGAEKPINMGPIAINLILSEIRQAKPKNKTEVFIKVKMTEVISILFWQRRSIYNASRSINNPEIQKTG